MSPENSPVEVLTPDVTGWNNLVQIDTVMERSDKDEPHFFESRQCDQRACFPLHSRLPTDTVKVR